MGKRITAASFMCVLVLAGCSSPPKDAVETEAAPARLVAATVPATEPPATVVTDPPATEPPPVATEPPPEAPAEVVPTSSTTGAPSTTRAPVVTTQAPPVVTTAPPIITTTTAPRPQRIPYDAPLTADEQRILDVLRARLPQIQLDAVLMARASGRPYPDDRPMLRIKGYRELGSTLDDAIESAMEGVGSQSYSLAGVWAQLDGEGLYHVSVWVGELVP